MNRFNSFNSFQFNTRTVDGGSIPVVAVGSTAVGKTMAYASAQMQPQVLHFSAPLTSLARVEVSDQLIIS